MPDACRETQRLGNGWKAVLLAFWLGLTLPCPAQEPALPPPTSLPEEEAALLETDWAAQLLDAILSSPNSEAEEALYRAAFAAGPAIVPQLEQALKDDRTAEFAAQALAFIGGQQTLEILWKLVADPRDLNLRRFYYGALGEFDAPEAVQTLLDVVNRADEEPDRTVTEAAILALTVRSDEKLVSTLREAEKRINDIVIQLDLENAVEVIEARARLQAKPGVNIGGSVDDAVRWYFLPALEPALPPAGPQRSSSASRTAPTKPAVKVTVRQLTLSPDQTRALARVIFEDPTAEAHYDIVLQKRYGNWTVASVWLGREFEKPKPLEPVSPPRPK